MRPTSRSLHFDRSGCSRCLFGFPSVDQLFYYHRRSKLQFVSSCSNPKARERLHESRLTLLISIPMMQVWSVRLSLSLKGISFWTISSDQSVYRRLLLSIRMSRYPLPCRFISQSPVELSILRIVYRSSSDLLSLAIACGLGTGWARPPTLNVERPSLFREGVAL